jgi:hypothetical protein
MSEIEPNGIEQPRVNLRLGMEFDLKVLVHKASPLAIEDGRISSSKVSAVPLRGIADEILRPIGRHFGRNAQRKFFRF